MHDLTFEAVALRSRAMVQLNLQEKLIRLSKLCNSEITAGKDEGMDDIVCKSLLVKKGR